MLVMRELDCELPQTGGISKGESRIISWGNFRMANRADYWPGPLEELRTMAADTGVVVRIIGDIGIIPHLLPILRRHFVASVTRLLVLGGCVGEFRVINRRPLGRGSGATARRTSLGNSYIAKLEKGSNKHAEQRHQDARKSCGSQVRGHVSHLPGSHTGKGFSTATHLTFLSFRFDIR